VKGWETTLRALTELPDATLALHGPTLTDDDRAELPRLQSLARELNVDDRVSFGAEVPFAEVPHLFGLADAVVNATLGNAADKVVYEAAAACLPVFAASPVFDSLLPDELRFHGDYPGSLAERIRDYQGGAGSQLRERVQAEYDEGGAIGRRYRRQDEIGTPWAVTVDHQSLEDRTVTLRDRDSLKQERIAIDQLGNEIERRLLVSWSSPKLDSGVAAG